MQSNVKAIEGHYADKNGGFGRTLQDWIVTEVSSTSANDWNVWTWEVYEDGQMKLIVNGEPRITVNDKEFVNRPYWGLWASTDEYPGSDPIFDWILVEPMD